MPCCPYYSEIYGPNPTQITPFLTLLSFIIVLVLMTNKLLLISTINTISAILQQRQNSSSKDIKQSLEIDMYRHSFIQLITMGNLI